MGLTTITQEDLNMVKYYIEEKGDVTRWSGWEEKKDAIQSFYPELHHALHNLAKAELDLKYTLDRIVLA